MSEKNLFTDLRDMFTGFKKGLKQLSGGSDYVELAYQDNPNHIFDNLLKLGWWVLYLCAAASLFFGISYHYKLFNQTGQGENVSILLAIILFLIAEIVSVFIGVYFFRFFCTGSVIKSKWHFLVFIVLGVCIYGAFIFRMGISAKAYAGQQASEQKTELAQKGVKNAKLNFSSQYDEQISDARATIARGRKQTWGGKLTPRGEYLVGEGNKTLQKYLDLKSKEFESKSKADSSLNSAIGLTILDNEKQLNGYGGLVEWMVLIITFLIALLEKVSYIENKKDSEEVKEEPVKIGFTPQSENKHYQPFSINKRNPNNIEGRKQIGFDYNKKNEPPPIEKKTNLVSEEYIYLEKIINSHIILSETETDTEKKNYYDKIINSHKILIELI